MQRDLRRLADTEFDLVVIGGGIYGTTAAWDAALRGLSVAIIDRADFGSGTSFNSAKTVHGGVRMLQSGNVAGMRQFVRERRALSRIAPHLVHPLPFVIPTYRGLTRHRWVMRFGMAVNDLLSQDRNDLADPAKYLPNSRLLSRDECLTLNPFIDPNGVTGGIEWFDCQMHNSDRVTLSFLLTAVAKGTVAANYLECIGALRRNHRVEGIVARDRFSNDRFDIRARVVLNAAGPWAPPLLETLAPGHATPLPRGLSKAMNLIVSRPMHGQHAVGGPAGSRLLFLAPWRGLTLAGTSHSPFRGAPDDFVATRSDVERFLHEVNAAFPALAISLDDIRLVHRGLLPAQETTTDDIHLLKQSPVRDHRVDGAKGLLSVLGVRYTTARHTAQQAIDAVYAALGRPAPMCRTAETPLLGGEFDDLSQLLHEADHTDSPEIDGTTRRHLALTYGTSRDVLLAALQSAPADRTPLGSNCSITRAEVRHAVRNEMAVHLSDAVLRRTEAGSAGHPGDDALQAAAAVMSEELGWSAARVEAEIAETNQVYVIPV